MNLLKTEIAQVRKTSLFGYSIDYAAAAAATKGQGVRPFQSFDLLDIVKVAIVLHIVANAVNKKSALLLLPRMTN